MFFYIFNKQHPIVFFRLLVLGVVSQLVADLYIHCTILYGCLVSNMVVLENSQYICYSLHFYLHDIGRWLLYFFKKKEKQR